MKLLHQIQDIFYDILGFVIPGFFALILTIPFVLYRQSFAAYIYQKGPGAFIYNLQAVLNMHFSWYIIIILGFVSYLASWLF